MMSFQQDFRRAVREISCLLENEAKSSSIIGRDVGTGYTLSLLGNLWLTADQRRLKPSPTHLGIVISGSSGATVG